MNKSDKSSGKKTNVNSPKENLVLIFTLVVAILFVFFTFVYIFRQDIRGSFVDDGRFDYQEEYQAVFLTNGQVYFGEVRTENKEQLILENIYYLQVNRNLQGQQSEEQVNPDLSLIKLGNELHGPTDRMVINADHVLFVEDLKDDSQVVEAINNNQ